MLMSNSSLAFRTKPHLWLIALIGVIVPRHLRADWRQAWEVELAYRAGQSLSPDRCWQEAIGIGT